MTIQFWSKLHGTKPEQWIGVPIKVGSRDVGYVSKVLAQNKYDLAMFEAEVSDDTLATGSPRVYEVSEGTNTTDQANDT